MLKLNVVFLAYINLLSLTDRVTASQQIASWDAHAAKDSWQCCCIIGQVRKYTAMMYDIETEGQEGLYLIGSKVATFRENMGNSFGMCPMIGLDPCILNKLEKSPTPFW